MIALFIMDSGIYELRGVSWFLLLGNLVFTTGYIDQYFFDNFL